jgi:hypothetical protein
MANFRWAYIDCSETGGSGSYGPANSIQFVTGSPGATTGSSTLTFLTSSTPDILYLTGNFNLTGKYSGSSTFHNVGVASFGNNIKATGSLSSSGELFSKKLVTSGKILATGSLSSSGELFGFTLRTSGDIVATSSISASTFYGDGSTLAKVHTLGYTHIATHFSASASFDLIGVNISSSVITASLYAANKYYPGQRLTFKDMAGSASTNNIVIMSDSEKIDSSSAGIKVVTDWGAVTVASNGSDGFFIIGTN